jgi:hypothetical protein
VEDVQGERFEDDEEDVWPPGEDAGGEESHERALEILGFMESVVLKFMMISDVGF